MRLLPSVELAIIEDQKLTDYLLSLEHPTGRAKARFFRQFGFHLDAWTLLRAALLDHAQRNGVAWHEETSFGVKYVVDGPLATPDGRNPMVRTVWFVESDQELPRFITAYPLRGR